MKIANALGSAAILLTAVYLAACASTPKPVETSVQQEQKDEALIEQPEETVPEGKIKKEPKPISVQNTSNQLENDFKDLLKRIDLKVVSSPKATSVNKSFNSSFVINVSDENGGVADLDITVNWPVGRSNDSITYSAVQIKTDASGNATFTAAAPKFAVKDFVTFYPSPVSSAAQIVQAAYDVAVRIPYAAKSAYIQYPGGVLFTYDFNEKGKPTTNNFTLLQNLRNSGVNVGNSPVSDTSYFDKSVYELYKATYDIVGKSVKFMVIGSFKYDGEAVEDENGVSVTLKADITCIDMANGNILYKTNFSETTTDKTKWSAEQKCRKVLAEKAADAIVYGM